MTLRNVSISIFASSCFPESLHLWNFLKLVHVMQAFLRKLNKDLNPNICNSSKLNWNDRIDLYPVSIKFKTLHWDWLKSLLLRILTLMQVQSMIQSKHPFKDSPYFRLSRSLRLQFTVEWLLQSQLQLHLVTLQIPGDQSTLSQVHGLRSCPRPRSEQLRSKNLHKRLHSKTTWSLLLASWWSHATEEIILSQT